MYRSKAFRIRDLDELLAETEEVGRRIGARVEKVFVADGDALAMPLSHWLPLLSRFREVFPRLRRVSCYATADNVLAKTADELAELAAAGLSLLYMGPESGDERTMRAIAKGPRPSGAARSSDYLFDSHVQASQRTRSAGMRLSTIFLLGAGGVERSEAHAAGSARLVTEMDPDFLAALTLTVVPGTPLAATMDRRGWRLPDQAGLLTELRTLVADSRPSKALFRTNHASNYLPLAGRLPEDRARIVSVIDAALGGQIPLRPEWSRGL